MQLKVHIKVYKTAKSGGVEIVFGRVLEYHRLDIHTLERDLDHIFPVHRVSAAECSWGLG